MGSQVMLAAVLAQTATTLYLAPLRRLAVVVAEEMVHLVTETVPLVVLAGARLVLVAMELVAQETPRL